MGSGQKYKKSGRPKRALPDGGGVVDHSGSTVVEDRMEGIGARPIITESDQTSIPVVRIDPAVFALISIGSQVLLEYGSQKIRVLYQGERLGEVPPQYNQELHRLQARSGIITTLQKDTLHAGFRPE